MWSKQMFVDITRSMVAISAMVVSLACPVHGQGAAAAPDRRAPLEQVALVIVDELPRGGGHGAEVHIPGDGRGQPTIYLAKGTANAAQLLTAMIGLRAVRDRNRSDAKAAKLRITAAQPESAFSDSARSLVEAELARMRRGGSSAGAPVRGSIRFPQKLLRSP
jgi:hypothetical protein